MRFFVGILFFSSSSLVEVIEHFESCIDKLVYNLDVRVFNKDAIGGRGWNVATQERKICDVEIEIVTFVVDGSVKMIVPLDRQK